MVVLQELDGEVSPTGQEAIVKQIRQQLTGMYGFTPYDVVLVASGSLPKTVSGKVKHYDCKSTYLGGNLLPYTAADTLTGGQSE
ncbi:Long-chain-fatty-acid--AMP ligase FadD32 [compost metagenome]